MTAFRDNTDRRWQADVSPAALARVAAAGQPLLRVAMTRIVIIDPDGLTINGDALAIHHRALYALVEPQARERGIMLGTFARVMDLAAIGHAWDAVIEGLRRRGLWPTEPIVEHPEYEDDDATPDSSATKA